MSFFFFSFRWFSSQFVMDGHKSGQTSLQEEYNRLAFLATIASDSKPTDEPNKAIVTSPLHRDDPSQNMRNLNNNSVTKGIAESTGLLSSVNGVHKQNGVESPRSSPHHFTSTAAALISSQYAASSTSAVLSGKSPLPASKSTPTPTYVSTTLSNAVTQQTAVSGAEVRKTPSKILPHPTAVTSAGGQTFILPANFAGEL